MEQRDSHCPYVSSANLQPRERAWDKQRGKKTLLSLTLVRYTYLFFCRSEVELLCKTTDNINKCVMAKANLSDGEFGWGGTTAKL